MYWCVTDPVALQAMSGGEGAMPSGGAGMGFAIPFTQAPESANLFVQLDAQMTAEGKTPVSWNFTTMPSEEWKNGVGTALAQYAATRPTRCGRVLSPLSSTAGPPSRPGQRLSESLIKQESNGFPGPPDIRRPRFQSLLAARAGRAPLFCAAGRVLPGRRKCKLK